MNCISYFNILLTVFKIDIENLNCTNVCWKTSTPINHLFHCCIIIFPMYRLLSKQLYETWIKIFWTCSCMCWMSTEFNMAVNYAVPTTIVRNLLQRVYAQSFFGTEIPTKTLIFLLPWISPWFSLFFCFLPHPMHSRC